MLKFPAIVVYIFIPLDFSFCFVYFEALLLGTNILSLLHFLDELVFHL